MADFSISGVRWSGCGTEAETIPGREIGNVAGATAICSSAVPDDEPRDVLKLVQCSHSHHSSRTTEQGSPRTFQFLGKSTAITCKRADVSRSRLPTLIY